MDIPVSTRDALNNNSKSDAPPQLLDTSDTTLDLFHDLQDSAYSSKTTSLPKLLLPTAPSLNKKRDLDDLIASSSDAPLFSSDDLLASNSENYLDRHRHKRQHRRLWYEEEGAGFQEAMDPFERPRIRGPFTRKYDSGVWMGSDESIESEQDRTDAVCKALRVMGEGGSIDGEDVVGDLESATLLSRTPTPEEKKSAALYRKALQMTEDPGDFEGPVFPYWGRQPDDDQLERFHTNQEFAYEKVMQCVDAGGEVVDLS